MDNWSVSIIVAVLLLLIIILLVVVLLKLNNLLKNTAKSNQLEVDKAIQNIEFSIKTGFNDFRKELREVSIENRRETYELFKNFQDTLLTRIAENNLALNQQFELFKATLNQLSEKLINNDHEFQQAVTLAFQASNEALTARQDQFRDKILEKFQNVEITLKDDALVNRRELNSSLSSFENKFAEGIKDFNEQLRLRFADLNQQQQEANTQSKAQILDIKLNIDSQLKAIREDNNLQLTEMRKTVDEKLHDSLEKRLGESFKQVSDRLEQVHKGLGEMQSLAIGVGDLKKVLSNIKTRGILGEYQLGNILEQILTPEQYDINVATKQGSKDHVEFAVKLPGKSDDKNIWLPIDSKFPLESYQNLLAAIEEGNLTNIDSAEKLLLKNIEGFAKDISSKYIDPPQTTDFAILFLPIESLYAEVLRHPQLFERLQRTYRITITGPTTLSALLNSLNMGFRTLAVQKRSSEVWKVLAEVKTEFFKYSEQLATVHKYINSASTSLETLQATRTKAMERKLRNVEALELDDNPVLIPVKLYQEED